MKNKFIVASMAAAVLLLGIVISNFLPIRSDKNAIKDNEITTVYLAYGSDRIFNESELNSYPQVAIVNEFKDVMEIANNKFISIWIDKNAVNLVDNKILSEVAMRGYPVALIGYSNEIYSFKKLLDIYGIKDDYNFNNIDLSSGYSVALWQRQVEPKPAPGYGSLFWKGYNKEPRVGELLSLTNMLMKDNIPTY